MKRRILAIAAAAALMIGAPAAASAAPEIQDRRLSTGVGTWICYFEVTGGGGSTSWANTANQGCESVQSRVARYVNVAPTYRLGPVGGANSYVSASGGTAAGEQGRALQQSWSSWHSR